MSCDNTFPVPGARVCGGIVVSHETISFCEALRQLRRAGILESRAIASGAREAPVKGEGHVDCLYMEAPGRFVLRVAAGVRVEGVAGADRGVRLMVDG